MAQAGLLARAEQYLGSAHTPADTSFYAWAARYQVSHAYILQHISGYYIPVQAVGMDAASLVQACSTSQFWEGTLAHFPSWQSFTGDEELSPFFQIFSGNYRQALCSLHILRTKDSILIAAVLEGETFSLPPATEASACTGTQVVRTALDANSADYNRIVQASIAKSPAQLLLLSLKLAVEEAIEDCPYYERAVTDALKAAIYAELYAQCKTLFQAPNTAHSGPDDEIKILLFSHNEPDEMLLRFHISQSFLPILGNAAQKIVLLLAGTSRTEHGALSFLEQG